MSIRLRLAALFTLATVLLTGVGAYIYIETLRSGLESSLDQSLQVRAGALASALAADPSAQLPNGDGGFAQVYAPDGRVLRGSPALAGARLLSAARVAAVVGGAEVRTDHKVPVHNRDEVGVEMLRVYGVRVHSSARVVAVATGRDLIDDAVQRSARQITVLGVAVLALAGPGSWLLARAALRPVERMRAQAASLEAANATEGVAVPQTRDELARLGRTFNDLLGRLHAALERERSFVADAGHELRTPLTVLKGEFELAQRPGRSRQDLLETIDIGSEETERLIRLTESLLLLAREDRVTPAPVDLADVVRDAIAAARPSAAARDVSLQLHDDGVGVVSGDAERLRQAVDNLLSNGVRYAPPGSAVAVHLRRDGEDAVLEVIDDGPGFPPDFLPSAFERFARADEARNRSRGGHGLGLAIVAAIMTAHGGTATAANRAGGGALLTLRWPQPDAGGTRSDIPADQPPVQRPLSQD